MNGQTNVQVVGFAAGLATITLWLLGFFLPALMATTPTGLEAAITGLFAVAAGLIFKPTAGIQAIPGMGNETKPPFPPLRLWLLLLFVVPVLGLMGCANNPIAIAESPAQKGYAIERSYNIVLEQGLELARSDVQVRSAVQRIEQRTTPIVDSLSNALADYEVARAEYELAVAAQPEDERTFATRLTVVVQSLESWVTQARGALLELARAIH